MSIAWSLYMKDTEVWMRNRFPNECVGVSNKPELIAKSCPKMPVVERRQAANKLGV